MNNVTDQFLKDTVQDQSVDILEQPFNSEEPDEKPQDDEPKDQPDGEDVPDADDADDADDKDNTGKVSPKTRRERRLVRKLEAERESSRQMSEKLQTISSAAKDLDDAEYLKGVERIYGNDTPEAQMATDLLKNALVGIRKDAEDSAYNRVKSERESEQAKATEMQQELESYVDDVEEAFNVTLSESQERGFLKFLEKMSPKDKAGNVVAYADPVTAYELYKDRNAANKPTPTRAKNVANRSMNQSTSPEDSKIQDDSNVRFLQENGII